MSTGRSFGAKDCKYLSLGLVIAEQLLVLGVVVVAFTSDVRLSNWLPCSYLLGPLLQPRHFRAAKVYTKGVFSCEKPSASTGQKKRDLVYTQFAYVKGKEGEKYIRTKEPSRCLPGISSHVICV